MTDLSEDGAAFEVRGPSASVPSVEAWAPAYIPYEPRGESRRLRDELRRRIGGLRARDGEILHCAFSGWKPDNADIENVLLYNVHDSGGCFRAAVGEGLRFELVHADPPPTPSGDRSGSHYSYRLVPAGHGFAGWRLGAEFASWRSVDLGQLAGPKKLEGVWWALRHSDVAISAVERASNMPFSVSLTLHPPVGHTVNPASLLKGLLDGVVCAFQVHWDHSTVDVMASRLAKHIDAPGPDIAAQLVDERRAVLGGLPRLVHARGKGVQWRPDDHLLVAGSLLLKPPLGEGWKLSGAIHEVRSTSGE